MPGCASMVRRWATRPCELVLGKREVEATGSPVARVDSGLVRERLGERGPLLRRAQGPHPVLGHAQALALDPDQREVAARRAQRDVPFVEKGHPAAGGGAPRDGGTDQSAADDGDVEFVLFQGVRL
jgi:hypothetical protein